MDPNESLEIHVAITVVNFCIGIVMVHLTLYSDTISVGFLTCTKQ